MRLLTRRGVLVEDMGQTYLAEPDADGEEARTLRPLQAAAITYCIAFGPRAGQKVLTLRGAMPREDAARQALSNRSPAKCCARCRRRAARPRRKNPLGRSPLASPWCRGLALRIRSPRCSQGARWRTRTRCVADRRRGVAGQGSRCQLRHACRVHRGGLPARLFAIGFDLAKCKGHARAKAGVAKLPVYRLKWVTTAGLPSRPGSARQPNPSCPVRGPRQHPDSMRGVFTIAERVSRHSPDNAKRQRS
jgi:hypothetical protein